MVTVLKNLQPLCMVLGFAVYAIEPALGEPSVGLRAELENLQQARTSIGEPLRLDAEQVFCGSVRLTLVLAHEAAIKSPLLINSIAVKSLAVPTSDLAPGSRCRVDKLSSHPHGITERNTFNLNITDIGV